MYFCPVKFSGSKTSENGLGSKEEEIYEQKARERMFAGVKADNPDQNSDQGTIKGRTDEHIAKDDLNPHDGSNIMSISALCRCNYLNLLTILEESCKF